jgi:hypothetical protein
LKSRFLSALVAACVLLPAGTALADDVTVKVGEADVTRQAEGTPPTDNWVLYTRNAGTGIFVDGPGSPPLGAGSLNLVTPTGADKVYLFNYDHLGTPLSAIDALSYSTYRDSGANPNQVPAINVEVDSNGAAPGGYTVLVFEPVYNTDQGAVQDDMWQDWDAYDGGQARWWSSRAINGVCAFDCFVTWDEIVAANPDAVIIGGFGVNQGSGNPALNANADALSIGYSGTTTTYDFENLVGPPTSKDECKNGGWQTFNNPTFKNQGDCVSYVANGGKN